MTAEREHPKQNRFAVPLDDLEGAARVPADAQVVEHSATPPAEMPISAEELDRQTLLGITGAGRLNVR